MRKKITPEDKERILRNISYITQEDLLEFILNNDISFEEMKKTGQLHYQKQNWLKDKIQEIRGDEEKDNELWKDCEVINTVDKYYEYLKEFPQGLHTEEARQKIRIIEENISIERQRLVNDIIENSDKYGYSQVKNYLDEGRILESDLINSGFMTEEEFYSFMNPPLIAKTNFHWVDLPPLPEGNTDVYFFGIPASGKSCVLAGLLNEAEDSMQLRVNTLNKLGYDYCHYLIECVEVGYVPRPTPDSDDAVNFIECQVTSDQGTHPLSLIEMSGEYFLNTYEGNTIDGKNTIGAGGYLQNNNEKAIFFVIDYFKGFKSKVSQQRKILGYVLEKLKHDKIMDKTTVIKIVLTKCDLMPEGVDKEQYAVQFLRENYGAFIENLKEDIRRYNINQANRNDLHVHAFTLGAFKFGKIFRYDNRSSNELLSALLNASPTIRKKGFIGKLFDEFRK